MVTQELLKELFDYDSERGVLIHKTKIARRVKIGDAACSYSKTINRNITGFKYKTYHSAIIIFIWHHGYQPICVDHIDRNTLNDRIENLRAATKAENAKNSHSRKNSTSKYLGVYKKRNKWAAEIRHEGKRKHLGHFNDEKEAALAYNLAATYCHKEFANLNIIE